MLRRVGLRLRGRVPLSPHRAGVTEDQPYDDVILEIRQAGRGTPSDPAVD
jgi:hypothetical protein